MNVKDVKGAGVSLALMYKIFAKDYRVYFFDRRTVVKEGLTNWDLAEDIYYAMEALNIGSADVFGVSQGGMIAMALTLEHPKLINKLVLGGDKDMITTGGASVEIADKLDCEIYMYSEYGHAAYEEAGDFNSRIYEFLSK